MGDAVTSADEHSHGGSLWWAIGVGIAIIISWLGWWRAVASFDVVALAGTLIGGLPIFAAALEALGRRRMTMELSMTIALFAALLIGEFFTSLVITFFVLFAEWIESRTMARGHHAIQHVLNYLPAQATVRRGDATSVIPVDAIQPGDCLILKPGERIPVDGVVRAGHSFVDQATITGEAAPAEKRPGTTVFAGTMNQSGQLEIEATALATDSVFGRIVRTLEHAEQTRAPIQRIADRMAGRLVLFAFAGAILTFLLTTDLRATIAVIIVAGACGIAAGTPLAILGAIGQAARLGIIVKGGVHIETLGRVDTVIFDKTGTLTTGVPEVVTAHPAPGVTPEMLLAAAAAAEQHSEHPYAQAILRRARLAGVALGETTHFESTPGKGLVCRIGTHTIRVGNRLLLTEGGIHLPTDTIPRAISRVYVAQDTRYLGAIDLTDGLRPEVPNAIARLRHLGITPILLTGDAASMAETIAVHAGIAEYHAELLPHEKAAHIAALLHERRTVAAVGDGVNDAPALVRASVGVAMGSGTDLTRESADVLLIGNDILRFVETVELARRCLGIVRANFIGTLLVDSVGILLAACGLLSPLFAALIHVGSELAFLLNSARLLPLPTRGAPLPTLTTSPTSPTATSVPVLGQ